MFGQGGHRGPSKEELDFQRFVLKLTTVQFITSALVLYVSPFIASIVFGSSK